MKDLNIVTSLHASLAWQVKHEDLNIVTTLHASLARKTNSQPDS